MVFQYEKNNDGHYVCTICASVKKNQNTMHYHMKKHEGKMTYECKDCDKKFYQKYALDDHIKMTHSTDKIIEIKCPFDECNLTFVKKEHCRVHIARTHAKANIEKIIEKKTDSNVHSCLRCTRDFNSYPAILYHVMDHIKEEPLLKEKLKVI